MLTKNSPKQRAVSSHDERAKHMKKKGANASTNESIMASELKNSEHGNEKPAR